MNLLDNVKLICDGNYSIESINYSSGQLIIKADYTSDMEGSQCKLEMTFDRKIVRSPSAKLKFKAKSNNFPLTYTGNLADL